MCVRVFMHDISSVGWQDDSSLGEASHRISVRGEHKKIIPLERFFKIWLRENI